MTLHSQSFNDFKIFTYIYRMSQYDRDKTVDVELMRRGFAMFGAVNVYW